jgi:hypothetical protein
VRRPRDGLDVKSARERGGYFASRKQITGRQKGNAPEPGALRFYWRSRVNSDLVVARAVTAIVIDAISIGIVRDRGVPIRKSPCPAIGGLRERRCGASNGQGGERKCDWEIFRHNFKVSF